MDIWSCPPDIRQAATGWLATTPPEHPYRIGVKGNTREDAERRFTYALGKWKELHERDVD